MKLGDKVKIVTFNETLHSTKELQPNEDYWKLLGSIGTIQKDPREKSLYASFSKQKRVLVTFDVDLKNMGLIAHNNINNSLWILESDLEVIED